MAEFDISLRGPDGELLERLGGFEEEYGVVKAYKKNPSVFVPVSGSKDLYSKFNRQADGCNYGHFQEDGDREYIDVGPHPELSTAEDTDFLGMAYRLLRGHVKTAARYSADPDDKTGTVLVVDTSTCDVKGNSWSSHENFIAPRQLTLDQYSPAFIAHYMSRIVWSGAGHVTKGDGDGFRFELSEKAPYISDKISAGTTHQRGLVNLRDEPLADYSRFRRVHQIAGESVFSPTVNALRMATGSMILRACELGLEYTGIEAENPVKAMRQISADPTLKTLVDMADGSKKTGVDIQESILTQTLEYLLEREATTPQETRWSGVWWDLLDDLRADPSDCDRRVDWVVKQKIVDKKVEQKTSAKVSPYAVARQADNHYHIIAPREGEGMRLIRKGFFDLSPSPELLDKPMPLPESTRARVRGRLLKSLNEAGIAYSVDWDQLRLASVFRAGIQFDPYETDDSKADEFLSRHKIETDRPGRALDV